MKNLLIFCDFYLPSIEAGGPLRSITAIIDALKSDFNITVVTRNHDLCSPEPYANIISNVIQDFNGYKILYLSKKNILKNTFKLLNNHYDIIYFNSFFSPHFSVIPQFIVWLKRLKARIIISPRGELGGGALTIKSGRKKRYLPVFKFLQGNKTTEFLASSGNERIEIEKRIGKNFKVTEIANLSIQKKLSSVSNLKKENKIRIVFVSRISTKKNILFALNVLNRVKGDVLFDIYGPIEDLNYWNECLQVIAQLPAHIEVKYAGALHPDQVIDTLKSYDLFFLPTLNENYGYAIVEALAAACPVLLSNQTPWHDLSHFNAGWEYDLSQPMQFVEKIDSLIVMNEKQYQQYKIAALNYYTDHVANNALVDDYKL